MSVRASWKGLIKLAMSVSTRWKGVMKLPVHTFPVSLYPVVSGSAGIPLHVINRETGNRLKCDWVDAGTGARVPLENRGKGCDVGDGIRCIPIEDDELESLSPKDSAIIEIEKFIPRLGMDVRYFDAPYYVAPGDASADEGIRYLRHLLLFRDSCAFAKGTFFGRDRSLLLQPFDAGVIAVTLHFAHKVREADTHYARLREAPRTINVGPGPGLMWAKSITEKFDGAELIDGYQIALTDLVRNKLAKRHRTISEGSSQTSTGKPVERHSLDSSSGRGPKPSSRRKAVTRAVH